MFCVDLVNLLVRVEMGNVAIALPSYTSFVQPIYRKQC
jgi:hypothetical protein